MDLKDTTVQRTEVKREDAKVALAREATGPHRHTDDKDMSGCLSSFNSHRADQHTFSLHYCHTDPSWGINYTPANDRTLEQLPLISVWVEDSITRY